MNLFDHVHTIRRTAASLVVLLAAVACTGLHRAEEFMTPEFLELTADANENELTLSCNFEGKGVYEAGFLLTCPDGEVLRLPADSLSVDELSSDSRLAGALSSGDRAIGLFSTTVGDLAYDATYCYSAWISNGQEEIHSETATIHTAAMQHLPIPDPALKEWLLYRYDRDGDGEISCHEAQDIDYIDICPTNEFNLHSLKGIEYMPNLMVIRCSGEWYDSGIKGTAPEREHYYIGPYQHNWETAWGPIGTLEYIDVTHNPKLKELNLGYNSALGVNLQGLDISNNPDLEILELPFTWLPYPDVSLHSQKLKVINFSTLKGDFPDLSNFPYLEYLNIDYPQDSKNVQSKHIDVSGSPLLKCLYIANVALSISDLSFNPELKELDSSHNNTVTELDLSACLGIEILNCYEMKSLKTLYLPAGVTIPGIWPDRDPNRIPDSTEIIFK